MPQFSGKVLFVLLMHMSSCQLTYAQRSELSATLNQPQLLQVRYYQRTIESELSDDEKYWIGLLKLALEKSGATYNMQAIAAKGVPHARLINNLLHSGPANIAFMGTSQALEKKLLPIRIPIFRGLMGYRILLTTKASAPAFKSVSTIKDLNHAIFGLGLNWPDEAIMKEAGLNVVTMPYYNLFNTLAGGRFQAISRAAHEIKGEYDILKESYPTLTIDNNFILAYRQASFFFVAPNNKKLASAITRGLENAYLDGSFLSYFNQHPAVINAMTLLKQPNRKWIWLENNHLSEETNKLPDKYWFAIR